MWLHFRHHNYTYCTWKIREGTNYEWSKKAHTPGPWYCNNVLYRFWGIFSYPFLFVWYSYWRFSFYNKHYYLHLYIYIYVFFFIHLITPTTYSRRPPFSFHAPCTLTFAFPFPLISCSLKPNGISETRAKPWCRECSYFLVLSSNPRIRNVVWSCANHFIYFC